MARWLAAVALDYGVIAAAMVGFGRFPGVLTGILALLVIGNRQHAIAILGHDGAHGHAAANPQLNDALTKLLCFWPLLIDLRAYRRFHFAHHKWLNDPDRDPEMTIKRLVKPNGYSPDAMAWQVTIDCLGCLVLGWREIVALHRVVGRPAILGPLCIAALMVAALPLWVAGMWFASLMTTFWVFFRARVWTEHVGGGTIRWTAAVWQRTLFAPHNTWLHCEHHARPDVPFYALRPQ